MLIYKNKENFFILKDKKFAKLYDWFCILVFIILEILNEKYIKSSYISLMFLFLFYLSLSKNILCETIKIRNKEELFQELNEFLEE